MPEDQEQPNRSLGNRKLLIAYLLAALSAPVTVLAFPDFDWSELAWFSLVPLLVVLPELSPRAVFGVGYFWAVLYYHGMIYWLYPVTGLGAFLLILLYATFHAILFWFFKKCHQWRSDAAWVVVPFAWAAMEMIEAADVFCCFPWCLLGYSQVKNIPLLQVCSVTGVFGLGFLLVGANAGLAFWIRRIFFGEQVEMRRATAVTVAFGLLLVGVSLWGKIRIQQTNSGETVKVALLQGNYDHLYKWSGMSMADILNTYEGLSLSAGKDSPDLVIWPETAIPADVLGSRNLKTKLQGIVRKTGAYSLVGALRTPTGDKAVPPYNSAILFAPDGSPTNQEYYKRHLVPFGEYVPFKKILFFVDIVSAGASEFSMGRRDTVFEVPCRSGRPVRFGVITCYESGFPSMSRDYVDRGAEFLVNITNDAWYGMTSMPYQHGAIATVRGVENGVPLLRSANTGLTIWTDAFGRVQSVLDREGQSLFVRGYLVAEPKLGKLTTFYNRFGNVFGWGCLVVTVGVGLAIRIQINA